MKYRIDIPKPCHEDWSKMTANEKGRFCSQCRKTVMDFRDRSTREIIDHLEASQGKTCGRFSPHQLGEKEVMRSQAWAKYLAAVGIMLSIGTTKLDAQVRMGKPKVSASQRTASTDCVKKPDPSPISSAAKVTIKGQILSLDDQPLAGVTVLVDGTTIGTYTDENGYFEMGLDTLEKAQSINLSILYLGFKKTGVCVPIHPNQTQYELAAIKLEEDFQILGDIEVSYVSPIRRATNRVGRFFRDLGRH